MKEPGWLRMEKIDNNKFEKDSVYRADFNIYSIFIPWWHKN